VDHLEAPLLQGMLAAQIVREKVVGVEERSTARHGDSFHQSLPGKTPLEQNNPAVLTLSLLRAGCTMAKERKADKPMSLELDPRAETILRQEAEREGVSIDELIVRRFARPQPAPQEAPAPDVEKERVFARLAAWQRQDSTPFVLPIPNADTIKATEALFRQWDEEDANMTDAKRDAEDRFWEEFNQNQERVSI
jgi:hypothetical protein